jgi:hypothetical protein
MPEARTRLPEIMARHQKEILEDWLRRQGEALADISAQCARQGRPSSTATTRGSATT